MKKFKFRLEKVLQFRDSIKAEKLKVLQIKIMALNEAKEHLEHLEQEFNNNQIQSTEQLLVSEVYIRSSYSERLKREVQSQLEVISQRQEEVAAAQAEYIEASKESEALHKFKERRHQEYLIDLSKEEEKYLDELSIQSRGIR